MLDEEQRLPHWRRTASLAALVLGGVLLLVVGLPFFLDELDAVVVLGFPLGFLIAAQGAVILFVVAAFWFAGRQERLDRRYGATDDG